ncbi:MAG TPA: hypothetical protein VMM76_16235 [Pirellulaceae bacterium]|nr:hypothetical protein [Pirellulaceae bacterium]
MLIRDEIQIALGASHMVPLRAKSPRGPMGLEQLAETVEQLVDRRSAETHQIQRSISFPLETWQKLDALAHKLTQDAARHVTASDIATSLVVQGLDAVESP